MSGCKPHRYKHTILINDLNVHINHERKEHRRGNLSAKDSGATIGQTENILVETCVTGEQLRRVADMRAEAFYEDSHFGRFTKTYKKQFSDGEYARLARWMENDGGEASPVVGTFVSLEHSPSADNISANLILGCMDILKAPPNIKQEHDIHPSLCEVEWYYIKNIVVDPAYRRRGIARQMLLAAEGMIRQSHLPNSDSPSSHRENNEEVPLHHVGIMVQVELSNINAVSLYESLGYQQCDGRMMDRDGPRVGVLALLSKILC